jgi:outer membrane protein insertion porin family
VVLASAFRLGAARGFEQEVIPTEQFYVGGSTTVRGFAEGRVAGSDYFGDPIGGNGSLTLNQEVRFPLFRWVRGVGFLDAGNVFARAGDLSFRPLEVGAGASG